MKTWNQLLAAAVINVIAFTGVAFASNPTPITECGFQITEPGKYRVENNIFCEQNDPFAISISNTHHVEVDLQDYQLRMVGQARGIGIYLHNSKHVDIKAEKNAFIHNFETGISLYGYRSGNQLFENRDVEIKGEGMRLMNNRIGLLVRLSRDVEVKKVRTQNNGRDWVLLEAKDVDLDRINLPANQY